LLSILAKLFVAFLILLALGYVAYERGYIDLKGNLSITRGTSSGTRVLWTNSNFTIAASDPSSHYGENVSLDAYVFNTFKLRDGTRVYEAYIGSKQALEKNPYDTSRRIVLAYPNGTIEAEGCYHLTGYIAGQATVTTASGAEIHPVFVRAGAVVASPSGCASIVP
jgi:hypothetical protein